MRRTLTAICAGLLVVSLGCSGGSTPVVTGPTDEETIVAPAPVEPPVVEPKVAVEMAPVVEEPPTEMPSVQMTDAARALCLIGVGDTMPDAQLPDAEGVEQSLASLRGTRATVVLFWTASGSPIAEVTAISAMEDLQVDVVEQYADRGIQVISINENDSSDTVTQLQEHSAATFPMLLDPEGAYFQGVATERLPRLYVLDADGQILWLDFGYSETTRDTLQEVLRYLAQ